MRPILLRWRGLTIWSYPAMLYLGLVAGVAAGNLAAHSAGVDPFRVMVATLLLVIPALVGARLLYVVSHWRLYRGGQRRIWDRREGGAAMYGGLAAMLALSLPLLPALELPWGAFWDVASFSILVGMVFTRFGCLLNGCCAGRPTCSWLGLRLPDTRGVREPRIPTQVLEAGWAALLLVAATVVWRRLPFPGALFLGAAAAYAAGRLALESARQRSPGEPALTMNHALSAAVILSSLGALAAGWPQ
jgi:phosphatidylglycerol:prolipoprotein diacylglycerol transferase